MIVVTVSEEYSLGFELEIKYFCGDEVGFISGVDDESVFGLGIITKITVSG